MTDAEKFKELIESSQKILVTSHISPDPDAVCSTLLVGNALKTNFSEKNIAMVLEEKPAADLAFLNDFSNIKFSDLAEAVDETQPELLILVDGNSFQRCSRHNFEKLKQLAQSAQFKTVAIDHHEEVGMDKFDVYINDKLSSTAEQVYRSMFEGLKLTKPLGYADTTMLGIITDSSRFKYADSRYRQTFELVSDLIDAGASIEALENHLERYTKSQLLTIAHLATNISDSGQGYTFTFIDDDYIDSVPNDDFKIAADLFVNQFLRNFERNNWGFIVYPDRASGPNSYGASFRSLGGQPDVSQLAAKLGGGGHKSAAGAKFKAENIEQAIEKVKSAITS